MKHTPGPWKSNLMHSKVLSSDDLLIDICELSVNENHDLFDYDQYKANALLIAAAPELLEALETIATMNSDSNSVSPFALTKLVEQIRIVAKSAISKAKGQ